MNLEQRLRRTRERHHLTRREIDVLALLLEGDSVKTTARKLGIAQETVRTHVGHIYRQLGVHTRAELFALIYQLDETS